jgi:hypothetical protein
MPQDIKSITYKSIDEYFKLDFINAIIEYKNNYSYGLKKNNLLESTSRKIYNIIDLVEEWNDSYIDNTIIDGISWHITIEYNNNHIKEISGKNAFPNNWNQYMHYKELLIKSCENKTHN